MGLVFFRVNHNFADCKILEEIMKRQFPPEEYMSLDRLLALQDIGDVEIWALYANKDLIGFTALRTQGNMAYLFFLAFDDIYQGKGYGKEAVRKIRDLYSDKAVTVDFELVDENATNNEQRIRRRNFYLKCGFTETGWGLEYLGVRYEIFCMNRSFHINSFKSMLNELPIKDFCPKYFKLLTARTQ
jgi:3-hexulose-6-phosphate synthase and related proteins